MSKEEKVEIFKSIWAAESDESIESRIDILCKLLSKCSNISGMKKLVKLELKVLGELLELRETSEGINK